MKFLFAVPLAVLTMNQPAIAPPAISDQAVVRKAVYGKHPSTAVPRGQLNAVLLVPNEVAAVYRRSPAATLALLTTIAEGAAPADAILAVGYALELAGGPGEGAVIVLPSANRVDAFDTVDEDWGHTPRQHWVGVVRKLAAK